MLFAYVVHVTVCVVYTLSCVHCVTLIQQMMCFATGEIWSLADRWITQCKWFVLYALQVLPNLLAFKIMSEWRICYRLCERSPDYCDVLCNCTGDLVDVNSARYKIEEWRSELWDLAHIGISDSDTESQDSLIFSQLTCWFISEVSSYFYYSIIIFIAYLYM